METSNLQQVRSTGDNLGHVTGVWWESNLVGLSP